MRTIIIEVQDGVVVNVLGLPMGCDYEIVDYDPQEVEDKEE